MLESSCMVRLVCFYEIMQNLSIYCVTDSNIKSKLIYFTK